MQDLAHVDGIIVRPQVSTVESCRLHPHPGHSSATSMLRAETSLDWVKSSLFASHRTLLDLAPRFQLVTVYSGVLLDIIIIMLLSYALS